MEGRATKGKEGEGTEIERLMKREEREKQYERD